MEDESAWHFLLFWLGSKQMKFLQPSGIQWILKIIAMTSLVKHLWEKQLQLMKQTARNRHDTLVRNLQIPTNDYYYPPPMQCQLKRFHWNFFTSHKHTTRDICGKGKRRPANCVVSGNMHHTHPKGNGNHNWKFWGGVLWRMN